MKICFIDEAGALGALGNPPRENDRPVLIIAGLLVDQASLRDLTNDFLLELVRAAALGREARPAEFQKRQPWSSPISP